MSMEPKIRYEYDAAQISSGSTPLNEVNMSCIAIRIEVDFEWEYPGINYLYMLWVEAHSHAGEAVRQQRQSTDDKGKHYLRL